MTKSICIDIEATGLSQHKDEILGIGLYKKGKYAFLNRSSIPDNLPEYTQIYHGGSFDCKWGIPGLRLDHDTLVMSSLLPLEKHDLESVACRYLRVQPWKKKVNRKKLGDEILKDLKEYNLKDCKHTYDLAPVLYREIEKAGQLDYYNNYAMPTARFMCELNQRGIRLDLDKLYELRREYEQKETRLRDRISEQHREKIIPIEKRLLQKAQDKVKTEKAKLQRLSDPAKYGAVFNPNSSSQLLEVLSSYGYSPTITDRKTNETKPSTSEEALSHINHPLIIQINNLRKYNKLLGTYLGRSDAVKGWDQYRIDDVIYPNFYNTTTRTGRTSSDRPNIQNVPIRDDPRIRDIFIPREGYMFMDVDYGQIELMIAAHFSSDNKLVDLITRGVDIHNRTAIDIFNLTCKPEDVKDLHPNERNICKTVVYLSLYDGGAQELQGSLKENGINKDLDECKYFLKEFYKVYPDLRQYHFTLGMEATRKGYVTSLFNRKIWVPREEARHKALNYKVQGSASELLVNCAMDIDKQLINGGRIVAIIHDEILMEVKEKDIEYTKQLLHDLMVNRVKLNVPLKVDIGTGKSWGDAK